MSPIIAHILLLAAAAYILLGLLVAVPFVVRRVDRHDAAAAGAGAGFRLMILPGCLLLWPLVARWSWRAGPAREPGA